ncbi:MAG TPA: NAD(P)/FAD-dependent oxidoreductase, partial [Reyranella sp.]|nr:NAD(P)/FAD-dependent oxidoreductase [Reyranella sp.]
MAVVLEDVRPCPLRAALPAPVGKERKPGRKRIVIVGGGFAGVAAVRALRRCEADVLLVDRRNHHIFQPLLYQVATALLSPAEIAAPLRQLAVRQANLDVLLGEATGVDLRCRALTVSCVDGGIRVLPFDFLLVATGMQPNYFGHDEFARYAPGLKTLADAEAIRAKILRAYERADETDDVAERLRQMTFVVVGAGPAGVELAASLAQMAAITLRRQYRRIDPAKSSIILVEGGKRILPSFAERLGARAARRLEKLGVKIMTGAKVEKVDENGVVADGKPIPSATVLWTAGVSPSPIVKLLGGKTDRAGRVSVGPFMNLEDVPGVFVVGDASSVVRDGRPVPGVAPSAKQEGRHVAATIKARLRGDTTARPFHYRHAGDLATI